jgi:hypothetical protein
MSDVVSPRQIDFWLTVNRLLEPFIIPIGHPDSHLVEQSASCFNLGHLLDITFEGVPFLTIIKKLLNGFSVPNPSDRYMLVSRRENKDLFGEVVPPGTHGAIPVGTFSREAILALDRETLVTPALLAYLLWVAKFMQIDNQN